MTTDQAKRLCACDGTHFRQWHHDSKSLDAFEWNRVRSGDRSFLWRPLIAVYDGEINRWLFQELQKALAELPDMARCRPLEDFAHLGANATAEGVLIDLYCRFKEQTK